MDHSANQAPQCNLNADFPYEDLPQGQIRLLIIRSAKDMALDLSLEHYRYNTDLEYEALSYASRPADGAQIPSQFRIQCNGASFYISSDLSQAIRCVAALKASLPLWVDYLCTDQENIKEKEWQLKSMGEYYARARMVWIWLGP